MGTLPSHVLVDEEVDRRIADVDQVRDVLTWAESVLADQAIAEVVVELASREYWPRATPAQRVLVGMVRVLLAEDIEAEHEDPDE